MPTPFAEIIQVEHVQLDDAGNLGYSLTGTRIREPLVGTTQHLGEFTSWEAVLADFPDHDFVELTTGAPFVPRRHASEL
ncbi:hypothetical protein [Candidatus Frankia alpina]|uniref:Uncharacterized protein n=1 Tax=Candidatus Frankia alpina TaxID=2699483 RepID=A0A4S5ERG8_9ACTN|nr:hypothetical protein [Candidatus Frankia alpina]THJ74712.1 hypothetical protein E7Y31_09820 [Candidatus Frankia alpina]